MDYTYSNELQHWGIKGMKWGVRRYQNTDGSLTPAGQKRYDRDQRENSDDIKKKQTIKKVAGMAVMTATVATAAVLYSKNQEAVNRVVKDVGKTTLKTLKTGQEKAVNAGKQYVKDAVTGVKEGLKESAKEAPKKATKAIVTGIVMNAAKRQLDKTVGKEEAARIFKANNGKKIDSFWKVGPDDKDDD